MYVTGKNMITTFFYETSTLIPLFISSVVPCPYLPFSWPTITSLVVTKIKEACKSKVNITTL